MFTNMSLCKQRAVAVSYGVIGGKPALIFSANKNNKYRQSSTPKAVGFSVFTLLQFGGCINSI